MTRVTPIARSRLATDPWYVRLPQKKVEAQIDPIDALEERIRILVDKTPAPGRNCARSALRHIDLAERIREIDPAMSYFRMITAEEEAASAVFHSLRRWKYPQADRLSPKSHVHKMALKPFTLAVRSFLWRVKAKALPEFHDTPDGTRARLRILGGEKESVFDPPLDFSLVSSDSPAAEGTHYGFDFELEVVTRHQGADSVLKYVRNEVTERRRLLYASTEGFWAMDAFDPSFFAARRRIVLGHLLLFLMIDPFPRQQLLIRQCLPVFLRVIELLPSDSDLNASESDAAT